MTESSSGRLKDSMKSDEKNKIVGGGSHRMMKHRKMIIIVISSSSPIFGHDTRLMSRRNSFCRRNQTISCRLTKLKAKQEEEDDDKSQVNVVFETRNPLQVVLLTFTKSLIDVHDMRLGFKQLCVISAHRMT